MGRMSIRSAGAESFIESVLATETEIGIVGVDGGDSENVDRADRITEGAKVLRGKLRMPSISKVRGVYIRCSYSPH